MTALCAGKDPEWWTPAHEQARLATRICSLCKGCPDNDPAPHGVIRHGIAYNDNGRALPACPNCGRPNTAYRGGTITPCPNCAVPDVAIPSVRGDRLDQIRALVARQVGDEQIAAALGMRPDAVRKLRHKHRVLRRARPLPVPDRPFVELVPA